MRATFPILTASVLAMLPTSAFAADGDQATPEPLPMETAPVVVEELDTLDGPVDPTVEPLPMETPFDGEAGPGLIQPRTDVPAPGMEATPQPVDAPMPIDGATEASAAADLSVGIGTAVGVGVGAIVFGLAVAYAFTHYLKKRPR